PCARARDCPGAGADPRVRAHQAAQFDESQGARGGAAGKLPKSLGAGTRGGVSGGSPLGRCSSFRSSAPEAENSWPSEEESEIPSPYYPIICSPSPRCRLIVDLM